MPHPNNSPTPSGYTSIMVPMDVDPGTVRRVKLAIDLADRFSSRLIGVASQPITGPMYFETQVEGVESYIEIEERRLNESNRKAESAFREIAGNRNRIEWRPALKPTLAYILEQARAADLIVAARPTRDQRAFDPMIVNGGDLVMGAGRPVLFVPPQVDYLSAKRIVVGWKDSREARRAVWDALPVLKGAQEVLVTSIGNDGHAAKDVANYLASHGVGASALNRHESTGSVGDELVRIAEQELSDLIVCGAYGHSRTGEWIFGGVTRYLLDHSPICCLMTH